MNRLYALLQKIAKPVYHFKENYISKSALYSACNKLANFLYRKSDDIPFMLLAFNAISVISSHIAQIKGLKKGDRENKDYLISQEYKELGLDMGFTIIPPFLLKNFMSEKLYGGLWTTKSAREIVTKDIPETIGASRDDLYNVPEMKNIREYVGGLTAQFTNFLKEQFPNMPRTLKKAINTVERNKFVKLNDINSKVPKPQMKELCIKADTTKHNPNLKLYNNSFYDEIIGQYEGMIIVATLAYTILASSVITPILKNKLANYSLEKQQKKEEKLKQLKNGHNLITKPDTSEAKSLDVFSNIDNSLTKSPTIVRPQAKAAGRSNPFEEFENFASINYTHSGMKI